MYMTLNALSAKKRSRKKGDREGFDTLPEKTKMATIYYANGTAKEVTPTNGTDFKLKEVQDIVGGSVEVVNLKDGRVMLANEEESKLIDLPRNEEATRLAELPSVEERWKQRRILEEMGVSVIDATMGEEDYIAGNVLVCRNDEFR